MTERTAIPTSTELAASTSLVPVWDPRVPFPSVRTMCDLDVITQVSVERAQPGVYHYLHETTIAWHRGKFYACWANNPLMEDQNRDEVIRGKTSVDGIHWSEPEPWVQAPELGASSFNHPLIFDHNGTLYGFFVAWRNEQPTTEVYAFDDSSGQWRHQAGSGIPGFLPFCAPQPTGNGDWIIGGEHGWYEAAVIISKGEDFTRWEMVTIPNPDKINIRFPETALVKQQDRIFAVCRPHTSINRADWHAEEWDPARTSGQMMTAPTAESRDGGRSWSALGMSNFPLAGSMPFAGRLSTGQNYLLTNSPESEAGRSLLSIAVTGPEGGLFQRIFKVRHQDWPAIRLFGGYGNGGFTGKPVEWSYPKAMEHDGKLYIIYTQGKEDCSLSIVPVEVLAIR